MSLIFHGFFHPSSSSTSSTSSSSSSTLQTQHLTSPPLSTPSLPLSRQPIYTSSNRFTLLPSLPFHVFPSGAHNWFFATTLVNCTSSSVAVATVDDCGTQQQSLEGNRTRLIAQNIPWIYTADDVRRIFEKYGVVDDVEVSMHNSTRKRGLAFVTMGSEEEAAEALNNLNLQQLDGRVIRVELARTLKKKPPPVADPVTKYNVFVGNLTWRVRSRDLRELFGSFNPNVLSAEVIFQTNPRRSAGYGFASFASKEEAEAAVSALNGKNLMGRDIRLILAKKVTGGLIEDMQEIAEQESKLTEQSVMKRDQMMLAVKAPKQGKSLEMFSS